MCKGIYTRQSNYAPPHSDGIVQTLLEAILTMIGYYVVILVAAMFLLVVVVQIFKAMSARSEARGSTEPMVAPSLQQADDASDELVAAVAAISVVAAGGELRGVSAWSHIERGAYSPWKLASRSRRISSYGG